MKILLRKYGNEYYVWKDATWDGKFHLDSDDPIDQFNILAIKDDDRVNSVQCVHCGAIIKNDPESIEKHFAKQEAKRDCLHCLSIRTGKKYVSNRQYEKNEDGTYTVTEVSTTTLSCSEHYWIYPSIDSPEAKEHCKYTQCRKRGVTKIEDVFIQYPDLFDKQVAVDVLNEKNSSYRGYNSGFFEYDLKCHDAVKAYVNELGVIDHFSIKFRGYIMAAFYSAKYDKLFFRDYGKYTESAPSDLSENRYNQAKAKISALYKEAKSK